MELCINWKEVFSVGKFATNNLEITLKQYQKLFKDELGMVVIFTLSPTHPHIFY